MQATMPGARIYLSQKPYEQISRNFTKYALCTSGFVDDVMFSYNVENRPVSKTARIFRRVR